MNTPAVSTQLRGEAAFKLPKDHPLRFLLVYGDKPTIDLKEKP